jgi:hypothetical protein
MAVSGRTWGRFALAMLATVCLVGPASCGSDDSSEEGDAVTSDQTGTAAQELRGERAKQRRERAQARRERARRQHVRERRLALQAAREAERREQEQREQVEQVQQAQECHPSYQGACLDPNASDYDCEGGSGDGPEYSGPVQVVGPDDYDLDSDGDGSACES